MEMPPPARKALFLLSNSLPIAVPGNVVRSMKLRPFSGNGLTWSGSMTLPASAFSAFKLSAATSQATVSAFVPCRQLHRGICHRSDVHGQILRPCASDYSFLLLEIGGI